MRSVHAARAPRRANTLKSSPREAVLFPKESPAAVLYGSEHWAVATTKSAKKYAGWKGVLLSSFGLPPAFNAAALLPQVEY